MAKAIKPWTNRRTALLRARVEKRHKRKIWGRWRWVHPRLVSQVFGDGGRMICLTPICCSPEYYVVRIDSSWNLSNWGRGELLVDHIDDIYEAIEFEFGDDSCRDHEDEPRDGWPAIVADEGSSWGIYEPEPLRRTPPKRPRQSR